jgi:type IV pilus assembly protein PilX
MKTTIDHVRNEKGYVMVATIMVLALVTIIGVAMSKMSTTESQISTNYLLYERAFYTAEAGLELGKEVLKVPFVEKNQQNLADGKTGDWSWALDGSETGKVEAQDKFPLDESGNPDPDGLGDFEGGVVWVDSTMDGINYKVTIWNNNDGGGPTVDKDGRIWVRSVATGPRGEVCSIETLLSGKTDGVATSGYKAQAGAGAGKNYRTDDLEKIDDSDLTKQQM